MMVDLDGDKKFSARDLFHVLNDDNNDHLDVEEFKSLFTTLNIEMPEEKQEKLLALCDMDCSGTIDEEEFASSWAYFHEAIIEQAAGEAGLSYGYIIVTVCSVLFLVVLVFAFVFSALTGWSNEGNFVTVIRSMIVTFIGTTVTLFRRRTAMEG